MVYAQTNRGCNAAHGEITWQRRLCRVQAHFIQQVNTWIVYPEECKRVSAGPGYREAVWRPKSAWRRRVGNIETGQREAVPFYSELNVKFVWIVERVDTTRVVRQKRQVVLLTGNRGN